MATGGKSRSCDVTTAHILPGDVEISDCIDFLAVPPGIKLRQSQELVMIKSPNLVPSKLGCRCIAYVNKRP